MVLSPAEIVDQVDRTAKLAGAQMVTFTGGEPFLQNNANLEQLTDMLQGKGYGIEAFTNGTFLYPEWAVDNISMIMDWKLPGSGEDPYNEVRYQNIKQLDESILFHSVKFVCKDEEDFDTAASLWSMLPEKTRRAIHWYYGKVWNGDVTDAQLAAWVMQNMLPWKLNVQLHNYIWPANERGR